MSQFFIDYKANPNIEEPFVVHERMKTVGGLKSKWAYVRSFETLFEARIHYPTAIASHQAELMQHELEIKAHRFDGQSFDMVCRACGKGRAWQAHLGGGGA